MVATVRGKSSKVKPFDHTEIARAIFAAAESMGMTDRQLVEQLIEQIIQRLERPQVLPGMEHLVPPPKGKLRHLPTDSEIQAMVREALAEKPPPETVEPSISPQPRARVSSKIKLTENALRVLERRYLQKDSQGQVKETPEEMFRRVAFCQIFL